MNNFYKIILLVFISTLSCLAKPKAKIMLQDTTFRYYGNASLTLTGFATDPIDGTLTGTSFRWFQNYRHEEHWHDDPSPFLSGSTTAVCNFPLTSDLSFHVFRRIILIVTNSFSESDTTYIDIYPKMVNITLNTFPDSLAISMSGSTSHGSITYGAVQGTVFTLSLIENQTFNSTGYTFQKWSDGKTSSTSAFYVPSKDTCLLAVFRNDQLASLPGQNVSSIESIGPIVSNENTISGVNQTIVGLNSIVLDSTFTNIYPHLNKTSSYTISGIISNTYVYSTTLNSNNFACSGAEINTSNITLTSGINTSYEGQFKLSSEIITITSVISTALGNALKTNKVISIISSSTTTGLTPIANNDIGDILTSITNPVGNEIICQFGHEIKLKEVSLFNLLGEEISIQKNNVLPDKILIDVQNLRSGIYLLVIHFNNVVKSFKIIKL